MTRILIVEDQNGPLEVLEFAVRKVCPNYFPEFHYDTTRCYEDARRMIKRGYDIVLLDHNLPLENMGDLENTDFDRFSDSLRDVGYSLIDDIKKHNPKTIIIGTSSIPESELSRQSSPDYAMHKTWNEAERDLDSIISELI